jgi:hypothetical protein
MQSRRVFATHALRERGGEHLYGDWPKAKSLEVLDISYAVDAVTGPPFEEPNEAMARRGPDGRMAPTKLWRARMPTSRDTMRLPSKRVARPNHS